MAAMTAPSAPTQPPAASATAARAGRPHRAAPPSGDADLFARMLQGTDAPESPHATVDQTAAPVDAPPASAVGDAAALAQWLQQLGLMVPARPASASSAASAESAADLPGLAAGAAGVAGLLQQATGLARHKGALPDATGRPDADQTAMPGTAMPGTAEAAAASAADPQARAGAATTLSLADLPGRSAAQPVTPAAPADTRATEAADRHDFAALLGDASAAAGQLAQQTLAPPTAWTQPGAGTTAPVSQPVAVPVHDPEFGSVMMSQVVNLARDGVQQAELHLNPAGMGPIMVQIDIRQDQARIQFEAAHADTRALIEQSLPTLAQSLRDDGLQLAASSVVAPPSTAQDLGASAQGGQPDASGQGWAGAKAGTGGGTTGRDPGRRASSAGGLRRGPGALSGAGDLAGPLARPVLASHPSAGRLDLYA